MYSDPPFPDLGPIVTRSTTPRPAALSAGPPFTWEDSPRTMPGGPKHRAPSGRTSRRRSRKARKEAKRSVRLSCGHHPALWWAVSLVAVWTGYLTGAILGLPR